MINNLEVWMSWERAQSVCLRDFWSIQCYDFQKPNHWKEQKQENDKTQ